MYSSRWISAAILLIGGMEVALAQGQLQADVEAVLDAITPQDMGLALTCANPHIDARYQKELHKAQALNPQLDTAPVTEMYQLLLNRLMAFQVGVHGQTNTEACQNYMQRMKMGTQALEPSVPIYLRGGGFSSSSQ